MRAIRDNGEKYEDYLDLHYRTHMYLRAYGVPIEPIRGEDMWPKSNADPIVPPKLRIMPGRPKKKRRREINEVIVKNKYTRKGRTMTCTVCKNTGHNKANRECPGRIASTISQQGQGSRAQGSQSQGSSVTNVSNVASECSGAQGSRNMRAPYHTPYRTKTTARKRAPLTGLGLYINPETGRTILHVSQIRCILCLICHRT